MSICEPDGRKHRNRKWTMSRSEIMTILIYFHFNTFRNFKHYYLYYVKVHLHDLFPKQLSYNRFVELESRVAVEMILFLQLFCFGRCTGISFIDSTCIPVCHNKRITRNKVFRDYAERGKSTMGWYFGFKLAKTEHTHPLRAVQSTHFWAENRLEIGLKNGALPFTCCERGMMNTEIVQKTEHCRSHRKTRFADVQWLASEKRSISVQYRLKRWKSLEKTEHVRSPVARMVFLVAKSHRKRSIAVQRGKNESLLSNDLRPKNGACPFTFSMKRQCASRKRSISVHYSALSYVISM